MELWVSVENFPDYEVSDCGRVRNTQTGKMLKAHEKRGYMAVTLYGHDRKLQTGVHRLVALAFLERDGKRQYVNHIDGDKKNNNLSNLEWVTASENMFHARAVLNRKLGMIGKHHGEGAKEKIRQAHLGTRHSEETKAKMRASAKKLGDSHRSKKVKNKDTGEVFDCIASAGEKYGNRRNISLCCNGKRKTSNGYRWEYIQDTE